MPDAYYRRYARFSHADLYRMLMAGDPDQVDNLAGDWRSLRSTLDGLAASLSASLDRLGRAWTSDSGAEYQRRLTAISSYSARLSADFDQVHEGLGLMAARLREARAKAESPAETDDADKTVGGAAGGAAIGAALAGPAGALVGGVIGAAFGHQQDEAEKEKAHQRMIRLVADLAADYETSAASSWPAEPATLPSELPSDGSGGVATPVRGPAVAAPGRAPRTGGGAGHGSRTTVDPGRGGRAVAIGVATVVTTQATVEVTAGTPSTGEAVLLGTDSGVAGAGVLGAASFARLRGEHGDDGGPGSMGTGTYLAGRTAGPAGMGPRAGVVGGNGVLSGYHAGGHGVVDGAAGPWSVRATLVDRGGGVEAPKDERMSWFAEDDLLWGGSIPSVPAVLGGESRRGA